jgi:hypothetical protein
MVALVKQMLHSSETYVTLADIAYLTTRPISLVLSCYTWTDRQTGKLICIFLELTVCEWTKNQLSHLHDKGFEYLIDMTFPKLHTSQS